MAGIVKLIETRNTNPQATVAKYMVRQRKPPSQTWRIFHREKLKLKYSETSESIALHSLFDIPDGHKK